MPARVAIVMRSKNEMPHLRAALGMLARQTFRDFDLSAVDSGSTDGSVEELLAHAASLRRISPEEYEPGRVLNQAIAQTGHPIVVLLNADAVPQSEDWLEKLLLPILGKQADAAFSRQIARPDARFVVAYDYERAYAPGNADPLFFSAAACAFRRELWESHPFREHGYAEDAAWARTCIENGARFRLAADSVVEHSHNYSLKGLFRKHYRQAITFGKVPNLGRQAARCVREIFRDFLHACRKLKFHTIPYNIAYRIAIHAGLYRGLRNGNRGSAEPFSG